MTIAQQWEQQQGRVREMSVRHSHTQRSLPLCWTLSVASAVTSVICHSSSVIGDLSCGSSCRKRCRDMRRTVGPRLCPLENDTLCTTHNKHTLRRNCLPTSRRCNRSPQSTGRQGSPMSTLRATSSHSSLKIENRIRLLSVLTFHNTPTPTRGMQAITPLIV